MGITGVRSYIWPSILRQSPRQRVISNNMKIKKKIMKVG